MRNAVVVTSAARGGRVADAWLRDRAPHGRPELSAGPVGEVGDAVSSSSASNAGSWHVSRCVHFGRSVRPAQGGALGPSSPSSPLGRRGSAVRRRCICESRDCHARGGERTQDARGVANCRPNVHPSPGSFAASGTRVSAATLRARSPGEHVSAGNVTSAKGADVCTARVSAVDVARSLRCGVQRARPNAAALASLQLPASVRHVAICSTAVFAANP